MLEGLFPEDIQTAYASPAAPPGELAAEDLALVATAVPKRQREFATGRACARQVLAHFGIVGFVLRSAPTREPIWPEGIVGSLTHTDGLCAVAAGPAARYAGIGIDAEPALPLPADLVGHIAHDEEIRAAGPLAGLEESVVHRLRFSAKEAVYKCQFALTRRFLEFHEVVVALDPRGQLTTRVLPAVPELAGGTRILGRWARRGGFLLVAAWILR